LKLSRRHWILSSAAAIGCRAAKRPTGELVLSLAEDRGQLDPARLIAQDWNPLAQVYETLVRRERDGLIAAGLARGWRRVDEREWRFDLRRDVVFHNGGRMDARAAARSIERAAQVHGSGQPVDLASVSADESSLTIRTRAPFAPLLDYLAYINFGISSGDLKGTGPFALTSYDREDRVHLVRNEAYWGARPWFQQIEYRFLPDAPTRLLAIEAGELDGMRAVPSCELRRLRQKHAVSVSTGPGRHMHFLGFNMTWSPMRDEFRDRRFREAVNIAVDRLAIAGIFDGVIEEASSPVPPWMIGAVKLSAYTRDLRRAHELLDACGWSRIGGRRVKGGRDLRLRLYYHPTWLPQSQMLAELLQAQLAEAGIGLHLWPADWPAANTAERAGLADIRHRGLTFSVGGTHFGLWTGFSASNSERTSVHYTHPEIEERLKASLSAQDANPHYAAIQRHVREEHVIVPLFYERELFAVRREVRDFPAPHPFIYPLDLTHAYRSEAHGQRA